MVSFIEPNASEIYQCCVYQASNADLQFYFFTFASALFVLASFIFKLAVGVPNTSFRCDNIWR